MKVILPFILISLIALSIGLGQDFREGYIIDLEKDTIKGEIAYQSHSRYFKSCVFRNSELRQEYFPNQIFGYGFNEGRFFVSGIAKAAFTEAIITGDLSLYQSDTSFFMKKGEDLYELKTRKVAVEIDGVTGTKSDDRWKGIISLLISDCIQNPMELMFNINFQVRDLSRITIQYNKCVGNDFDDFGGTKKRGKIDFGLIAGYTKSSISINGDAEKFEDLYSSMNPMVGIITQLFFPRFSERIGVQAELLYMKSSYQGFVEILQSGDQLYYDTYMSLATFSLPIAIKYIIPIKSYSIFLNAGMNNDFLTKRESLLKSEYVDELNSVSIQEDQEMFEMVNFQPGIYSGVGLTRSLNKLEVGLNLKYFHVFALEREAGYNVSMDKLNLGLILLIK